VTGFTPAQAAAYDRWKTQTPEDANPTVLCPRCKGECEYNGQECGLCEGLGEVHPAEAQEFEEAMIPEDDKE
jgi:DnaJ-class molecular chaperone